jgi:hypothetical protein
MNRPPEPVLYYFERKNTYILSIKKFSGEGAGGSVAPPPPVTEMGGAKEVSETNRESESESR